MNAKKLELTNCNLWIREQKNGNLHIIGFEVYESRLIEKLRALESLTFVSIAHIKGIVSKQIR